MLNENEVKEKIITLRSGNAKLAIIPEVGACITRYCLKTEEQVLELMRPGTQAGITAEDPLEMGCFPLIPFSSRIRNGRFSFQGKQINASKFSTGSAHNSRSRLESALDCMRSSGT